MTPWARLVAREAVVLPGLLLAVAAGGGFRTGAADGAWQFLPPSPMALVLGLLLVGVLVRTGVVAPWVLIGPQRSGLANANGAVLLATLLLASAQVFTSLTPEAGLLQVLASVFFVLLLVNTLAAQPTRARAMQSLGVVLLAAFVLKYVVLEAAYAPEASMARRLVTTLLEGVSLGALGYTPHGAATAYVAFVAILVYLFALVLLPGDDASARAAPTGPATASLDVAAMDTRSLTRRSVPRATAAPPARPDPDDR